MGTEGYKFPAKDKYALRESIDELIVLGIDGSKHSKLEKLFFYVVVGSGFFSLISIVDTHYFFEMAKWTSWITFFMCGLMLFEAKKKWNSFSERRMQIYKRLKERGYNATVNFPTWEKQDEVKANPRKFVELSLVSADGKKEIVRINPFNDDSFASE